MFRGRDLAMLALAVAMLVAEVAGVDARRPDRRAPLADHGPAPLQLVLEGGAVLPGGDLGDDFVGTARGLGAGTGHELGARLRYWLGESTAVGPAFHYANFGDWEDVGADGLAYAVRTSVYRYGVDLQQFLGGRGGRGAVRPYLTLGVALTHNRYQDWLEGEGKFVTSSQNLALGVGGGVAMGPVELSAVWTFNPAENRQLPAAPEVTDDASDWSYLSVRAGLGF
jgi:hypothetical protein